MIDFEQAMTSFDGFHQLVVSAGRFSPRVDQEVVRSAIDIRRAVADRIAISVTRRAVEAIND